MGTKAEIVAPKCYTDDWQRTEPDYVVYLPMTRLGTDGYADHFLVSSTPGGDLLATWTMSGIEGSNDTRLVYTRSEDEGETWAPPKFLCGREGGEGIACMFAFPVMSKVGRIYLYYSKDKGIYDFGFRVTAVLGCHISDDDGRTWQDTGHEFDYARTKFDHPDPKVPCNCICWQKPVRDAKGRPMETFTRSSSKAVFPPSAPTSWGVSYFDNTGQIMRFDNIDEGPDPVDVKITWLPPEEGALRHPLPRSVEPEHSRGYCMFHEPSVALLPDGRIFSTASTVSGHLIYAVSEDPDGQRWSKPDVLRYMDDGTPLLHPVAPAPFYRLEDGRYLIFYHGHEGYRFGGLGPRETGPGRRPTCVSVGEYRPDAHQQIWFSKPKQLCDTDGVGAGPEELVWLAQYSSLTERNGRRVYWYPDRKHFLLGRNITDEWLSDMTVPKA